MNRMPTRDDCPTCNQKRDELGRLPIGFCDPTECLMAKEKNRVAAVQDLNEHQRREGIVARMLDTRRRRQAQR